MNPPRPASPALFIDAFDTDAFAAAELASDELIAEQLRAEARKPGPRRADLPMSRTMRRALVAS
jgi:hypothetical protein